MGVATINGGMASCYEKKLRVSVATKIPFASKRK